MADTSKSVHPRRRLGRGLSSLISSSVGRSETDGRYESDGPAGTDEQVDLQGAQPTGAEASLAVAQIAPNPYQPRREFKEADLAELAESIAQQGVIQPLIVVNTNSTDIDLPYTLVAGERRLRAARRAGLATVPCIIRQASDRQMLEWALVENIHRTDLNPLERAEAYRQYTDRFALTHAEAGQRLGQPRTTVSNYLRILELPEACRELISQGQLSFGHAKVLAGLAGRPEAQNRLAKMAAAKGLSVRQVEALAAAIWQGDPNPSAETVKPGKPAYVRDIEERLTQAVGTRVAIRPGRTKNTGRIIIEYYSLDDFDRIAGSLGLAAEG